MSLQKSLLNLSIGKIFHKTYRAIQVLSYKRNSHKKKFKWDWGKKPFNRIAVVNFLLASKGGLSSKYLEIGTAKNDLFHSVMSLNKTGVDPVSGGTHRMTSDEFFLQNKEKFDVIFIDGLHEYDQVYKDAINSLNAVDVGGWIAFHDFLPSSWKEHHVPRISDSWTGDCWKFAVQLLSSEGIEFKILDIDHGVCVMKKMSNDYFVPQFSENLKSSEFDKFVEIIDELPVISFEEGLEYLSKI